MDIGADHLSFSGLCTNKHPEPISFPINIPTLYTVKNMIALAFFISFFGVKETTELLKNKLK